MSSAIEVLKEMIKDYELLGLTAGINNKKKLYDADVKRINAVKEALLALEKQEKQSILLNEVFTYLAYDLEVNWNEYSESKYPKELLDFRVMIDLLELKYSDNKRFERRIEANGFNPKVQSFIEKVLGAKP